MTIRKKSRERAAKVEETETGPVFEEVASPLPNAPEVMTPTVLETPVVSTTRNGRVVGLGTSKRIAGESLDAKTTTRKVVGFNIKRMTSETLDVNVDNSRGGGAVIGLDNKRFSMAGEGLDLTKVESTRTMGSANKRIASEGLDSRAGKRKATRENTFDMNTRVPIPRHVVLLPKLDEEATLLNLGTREGEIEDEREDDEEEKEEKDNKEDEEKKMIKGERSREIKKMERDGEGAGKKKGETENNNEQTNSAKQEKSTDYNLTIRPLMGAPFEISLSGDCSVLELKDAIYDKIGILPEMQLLGSTRVDTNIDFNNEEQFLSETSMAKEEILHLSVKASTGLKMTNEISVGEDEYFMYEILSPDDVDANTDIDIDVDVDAEGFSTYSGNSSSSAPPTTTTSPLGSSLTATDNDNESSLEVTANVPTKTTTLLPISGLESYLKNVLINKGELISTTNGDKKLALHIEGLEALRISMSPYDESKTSSRSITPFTPVLLLPPEEIKFNNSNSKEEKLPVPTVETGPVKCNKCGIRLRLAGQFLCRCGLKFCGEHRYYDKHACDFDHKSNDRARLDSANPRVYKSTVEKL